MNMDLSNMDLSNMVLSIVAIAVSVGSLLISVKIYRVQKNDAIIQSFFDGFSEFLSYAGRRRNDDALYTLIKLKMKAGFLEEELYNEFIDLLPVLEKLNLTPSNPDREKDRKQINDFIIHFTKCYNRKSAITEEYLQKHL